VDANSVLAVIESEGLQDAVWFHKPINRLNSVAIYAEDRNWVVSATDERAVEEGRRLFGSEHEALESFLERLRAHNRHLKSSRTRREHEATTRAAIESEGLQGAVWLQKPLKVNNAVAIYDEDRKWVVSSTDEHAVEGGKEFFDRESQALESFLERLRVQNRDLKSSRANP
jgi:predicted RNase H-like HicB family nuclease